MTREVESLRAWLEYNQVARHGYFETLSKLPPEELTRDRGASFPTLLDILGHSMGGIETWVVRMAAAKGHPIPPYEGRQPENLDDLRDYQTWVERGVDQFFSDLTDEDLGQTFLVPKLPPWWDEDFTTTYRGTIHHVIEHELQHRGELNALLWQIDVEPPILDWDEFEKIRAGARKSSK